MSDLTKLLAMKELFISNSLNFEGYSSGLFEDSSTTTVPYVPSGKITVLTLGFDSFLSSGSLDLGFSTSKGKDPIALLISLNAFIASSGLSS